MPLMQPEVQALLRKVGALPPEQDSSEETTLTKKLDAAGLGLTDVLDNLAIIANGSGNEALRLSANRDALKMHGALKDNSAVVAIPSFTIIIKDSGVAPKENPIFLPRQLLQANQEQVKPN